jgi:signal transduction histidine kinase/ActR/RegA family two-component response regulator
MGKDTGNRVRSLEECLRELRSCEMRFRNLITKNADGIVIVDRESIVRFVNPAAEALFNRRSAILLGSHFGFPAVAGETTEMDVLPAGGSLAVAEMRVVETEWEGEAALLATLRDITERKRAEEERAQLIREQAARAEAEEANRLKDEFLATVSHELRSPLNSMLGWARLLHTGRLDRATIARAVETIERSAESQLQIIEDLLDVSRIVNDKLRLEIQPFDPASVIEAAAEAMRLAADAKAIGLRVTLDPQVGLVLGDPGRMQQVVWNLLSNAIKFTPARGQVEVRLERVDADALISVRDTGMGISPEFMPYVFERFRQADGSSTRKHGGLGLGLAIVRHLVEQHGGSIYAASEGEGKGATFFVRLPLMTERSAANQVERLVPATENRDYDSDVLRGVRVLIADDEVSSLEILATFLTQRGAEVTACASAAEAFEALKEWKPHVLVFDLAMPDEDGYALIRRVRTLSPDEGGKIPALALTAYARAADRIRAIAAGYQLHLAKPPDPAELEMVIATLAGRSGTGSDCD